MAKRLDKIFGDLGKIEPAEDYRGRLRAAILGTPFRVPAGVLLFGFLKRRWLGLATAGLAAAFLAVAAIIGFSSPPRLAVLGDDDFRADLGNLSADIDIQLAEVKYYQESAPAVAQALEEAGQNGFETGGADVSGGKPAGDEIDRLLQEVIL